MTSDPQLQQIADRFKANWKPSEKSELKSFLGQVTKERRFELAKLLIPLDIQFRLANGSNPAAIDYAELGPGGKSIAEKFLDVHVPSDGTNANSHTDIASPSKFYSEPDIVSPTGLFSKPDSEEATEWQRTHLAQEKKKHENKPASLNESDNRNLIGNYRLIKLLGSGGMGEVWMAEQLRPVKRTIALKLIKSGVGSKEIIARFDAERQALAMMNHPNIAKILDAGTTSAGQPYFVMELVSGKPLTTYCDQQRLSINDRLKLFADVCSGVQHAHQKGIIHRDLKPANIMIDEQDGLPVPKIIDFGLAKAMKSVEQLTDQSLYTQVGQILGTLKYMSPEQASLDNLDIDTRTDVYALGVILYELLTGATPLDENSIKQAAVLNILELIRNKEPIKPSSRLGNRTSAEVSKITGQRKTDSVRLGRVLAGDLDWIVMKALEKDRVRRYDSASSFADDIQRYLNNEPVVARPPSMNYRVRKFVRKNRIGVSAAALVALALVVGMIGTTWGLFTAEAERNKADIARKDAVYKSEVAEAERRKADLEKDRAEAEKQVAVNERNRADEEKRNAERQRKRAETQEGVAIAAQNRAEDALFQVSRTAYQPLLYSALTSFHAGNYSYAEKQFAKIDSRFRGWEWTYVDSLINSNKVKFKPEMFIEKCQLTPDGSFLISADLATSSLTVFDASNGKFIRNFLVHPNRAGRIGIGVSPICSWAMDPTGEWIVTAARFFPEIALSNLRTSKVVDRVPLAIEKGAQVFEPEIEIAKDFSSGTVSIQEKTFSFTINSNSKIEVSPEVKTNPGVFNNKLTKKALTIEMVPKEIQANCMVCFCPQTDFALCSDGQTKYYLVDSGDPGSVKKLDIPAAHRQPTSAAISPDKREIAIGFADQTILIWDLENDRLLTKLKTHDAAPKYLEYTSDGSKLLTSEHNVAFLQATSWRSQTIRASVSTNSPIIRMVGVASNEIKDEAILIETKDQEIWKVPLSVSEEVSRVDLSRFARFAISADGRYVGGYDSQEKEIHVFSLDDLVTPVAKIQSGEFTERKQIQTPPLKTGEARILMVKPGQKFSYPEKLVGGFDFDMAQKRCAMSKLGNGLLNVVDFDGTQLLELQAASGPDYVPKMSPHQKLVAIQYQVASQVVDVESVKTYNTTGAVIAFANHSKKWLSCYVTERTAQICAFDRHHQAAINLSGHRDSVTHGVFTKDDTRVFTGSADGTVRIWDVSTGEELLVLHQFSEPVGGLCLLKGGKLLVAVSESGSLITFSGGDVEKSLDSADESVATEAETVLDPGDVEKSRDSADEGPKFACKWHGENSIFVNKGIKQLARLRSISIDKFISDVSFDKDGSMIASWGAGTSDNFGIARIDSQGNVESRVPIKVIKFEKYDEKSYRNSLDEGKLWFYSGLHATNEAGDIYFSLGSTSPNAIMRFELQANRFSKLLDIQANHDIDIYNSFDPQGIYITDNKGIRRYEVDSIKTHPPKETFAPIDGRELVLSSEYITKDMLYVKLYHVSKKTSRNLLLDRRANSFYTISDDKLQILAVDDDGNLVAGSPGSPAGNLVVLDFSDEWAAAIQRSE